MFGHTTVIKYVTGHIIVIKRVTKPYSSDQMCYWAILQWSNVLLGHITVIKYVTGPHYSDQMCYWAIFLWSFKWLAMILGHIPMIKCDTGCWNVLWAIFWSHLCYQTLLILNAWCDARLFANNQILLSCGEYLWLTDFDCWISLNSYTSLV